MYLRPSAGRALIAALTFIFLVGSGGPAPAERRNLGAAVTPLRLVPLGNTPTRIAGLHSYFGTIQLSAAGDGLVVSDRLSLERYLLGLNEVPTDWPAEAMKAQAVAARTYALWTLSEPPGGSAAVYGFDICASVQCQVFSGADVVSTENGPRWVAAVTSTKGKAVLFQGRPILARYHSTSGGETFDNSQIFTDEPDYPYLQGVPSTTEQSSPLYRWHVAFPTRILQRILVRAGTWEPGRRRLVYAKSVASASGYHYPDIELQGEGQRVVMDAQAFREVVGEWAPKLFPLRYPSLAPTSSGRLPETLPSNRIDVVTRQGIVQIVGRGWGHGVGMSQWGAFGLAQQGAGYADILTRYYTGVTVGDATDPGPLSVGLDWGERSITASGAFSIVDGRGETLVKRAFGTWRFVWAGPGVVSIDPPKGYGLPLEVGIVDAPSTVEVGGSVFVTVALSRPAEVKAVTTKAPTGYEDPGVEIKEAGKRRIVWLAPLEPGEYEVHIQASTGRVKRRSEPVKITVSAPTEIGEPGTFEFEKDDGGSAGTGLLVAAAAVVLLAAIGLIRLARRDPGEPEPPR